MLTNKITDLAKNKLINSILLHSGFIDNPGLLNGKMGIAIYFFHLYRETDIRIYEDYAGELIDDLYQEISISTPLCFKDGLSGIGWGIEYLVQNGFIDADTDQVLDEFDSRLYHQLNTISTDVTGLNSILLDCSLYFTMRIKNTNSYDNKN